MKKRSSNLKAQETISKNVGRKISYSKVDKSVIKKENSEASDRRLGVYICI